MKKKEIKSLAREEMPSTMRVFVDIFRCAWKNESLFRAKQVYRRAACKGRDTLIFLRQRGRRRRRGRQRRRRR